MDLETFAIHCGMALGLGTLIGIERQWTQHPAGLRTNALVALGASMFVGLSLLLGEDKDHTRIAAQVVSGLGFLGGGVILREGLNVHGLNTAATIWCSGAVGAMAGAGHPRAALIGTGCVLFIHLAMKPLVNWIEARKMRATNVQTTYRVRVCCGAAHELAVRGEVLRQLGGEKLMSLVSLASSGGNGEMTVTAEVYSLKRDDHAVEQIVARLSVHPEISSVRRERA